mmetsp:Transcript_24910/g.69753  ORF Transcript_24910/g.69753 Transcript_24910/m.69753 type:complete len:238 (+) Transcript_24910:1767-2480(+)
MHLVVLVGGPDGSGPGTIPCTVIVVRPQLAVERGFTEEKVSFVLVAELGRGEASHVEHPVEVYPVALLRPVLRHDAIADDPVNHVVGGFCVVGVVHDDPAVGCPMDRIVCHAQVAGHPGLVEVHGVVAREAALPQLRELHAAVQASLGVVERGVPAVAPPLAQPTVLVFPAARRPTHHHIPCEQTHRRRHGVRVHVVLHLRHGNLCVPQGLVEVHAVSRHPPAHGLQPGVRVDSSLR